MDLNIKIACDSDLIELEILDRHINKLELQRKIAAKQIYVIKEKDIFCGWLRYGLFWDNTPFMNMLFIIQGYRGRGIGASAVKFWECQMKLQGYQLVLTSTLSSEDAQHFYRKLGYKDAGSLLLQNEPLEVIFSKNLAN
jgi:GNAT superfamily N-acetyltransferase